MSWWYSSNADPVISLTQNLPSSRSKGVLPVRVAGGIIGAAVDPRAENVLKGGVRSKK